MTITKTTDWATTLRRHWIQAESSDATVRIMGRGYRPFAKWEYRAAPVVIGVLASLCAGGLLLMGML